MKRTIAALVVGLSASLAGCGTNQSALNPASGHASELAKLSWLLFALGTGVLLIVIVATIIAYSGSDRIRATLASHGAVVFGGIAFPVVVLTALLATGIWLTKGSQARLQETAGTRVSVVGEQWWWRLAYEGADGQPIATANELRVPVGRSTLLELTSADVIHSFWVPSLAGKIDMVPGRTTRLRLEPNAPGIFRGQCAEYCGGPHALMAFEVVAMPPAAFDAWLAGQAQPAAEPSTPIAQRGRELFLASGCGGCHAIGGTEANGTIGPDLTHLASRRSVGLDTTPLTPAAIAAFVRDGQHVKPGNLMPPFRMFAPDDLEALSTYLAGLK
jgi:cytochrome c oxidase subunit 2